jgi:hypothetical protein
MIVLKKLYSGTCLDLNTVMLNEDQAIKTVHALTNAEFYERIHDYIGWTIVAATYSFPDRFLNDPTNQILVAHYHLKQTLGSIQFTPITQYFGTKIESIVNGTIRAVGTIDSEGIKDSKRYERRDTNYHNKKFISPKNPITYSDEFIATVNAQFIAQHDQFSFVDTGKDYSKPINLDIDAFALFNSQKNT